MAVLVICSALVGGAQQVILSRTRLNRLAESDIEIRAALLLGLEYAMQAWSREEALPQTRNPNGVGVEWVADSSSGIPLNITLRDAQDRFNLNHLALPVTPTAPRPALRMLEALLSVTDPEADPVVFQQFQERVAGLEPWFSGVEMVQDLVPETAEQWRNLPAYMVALPHPRERWLPLNVNTASPEVLLAVLGVRFKPFVELLIAGRQNQPIERLDPYMTVLPLPVQVAVREALTVRSSLAEVRVETETPEGARRLTAWLQRKPGGEVEVIRCQW
jgi:type II secretory pathway component PulK